MSSVTVLSNQSSIREYLESEVFPELAPPPYGDIRITRLSWQKPVFLFREKSRHIAVVGKSFKHDSIPLEEAWEHAEKEYLNLKLLRDEFGMNDDSCKVVAPLGKNKDLSAMLVMERAPGQSLDYHIAAAIYEQQYGCLFDKLSRLAGFFSRLHSNSESDHPVSMEAAGQYLTKLLDSLGQGPLGDFQRDAIKRHSSPWWDSPSVLAADKEVIIHGDATPTNFLFQYRKVSGIDLERMTWSDRCWDLGFMAAELKHHFMWRTGNGWAAEPFIGHFLWEYSVNHKNAGGAQTFHDITRRIPVYMALGLLRIARNDWLDLPYRRNLMREAKRCLKYGLSSSITTARS
jgi:aminoglycoside phosphotransferase